MEKITFIRIYNTTLYLKHVEPDHYWILEGDTNIIASSADIFLSFYRPTDVKKCNQDIQGKKNGDNALKLPQT